MAKNQTAFALDPNVAVAVDGAVIPGIPGIWRHDEPVDPLALGLGVGEMRDLIERLGLPLVEVSVKEGSAALEFVRATGDERLPSQPIRMYAGSHQTTGEIDPETQAQIEVGDAARVVDQTVQRVEEATSQEETA